MTLTVYAVVYYCEDPYYDDYEVIKMFASKERAKEYLEREGDDIIELKVEDAEEVVQCTR